MQRSGLEAKFSTMESFRKFALAGNATFTMVSRKTGTRFTYRIRKPKEDNSKVYFVQLLAGPSNTSDYQYLGVMFGKGQDTDFASWRHGGHKSKISKQAPSSKAIEWLFRNIMSEQVLASVELWHEGRCGKCGRPLTVPSSIESGLGPVCNRG